MLNFKKFFATTGLVTLTATSFLFNQKVFARDINFETTVMEDATKITQSMLALHTNMRQLVGQDSAYCRNLVISTIANLEDMEKVKARLLKSQDDFANSFKPFYGDLAATKLGTTMKDQVLVGLEYVTAAKLGDAAQMDAAQKKWLTNIDVMVDVMALANPNWNKADLKDMFKNYIEAVTAEISARIKKDWDADIAAFDKANEQLVMLADALTIGIIKQFPDKFSY